MNPSFSREMALVMNTPVVREQPIGFRLAMARALDAAGSMDNIPEAYRNLVAQATKQINDGVFRSGVEAPSFD